MRVDVDRPDDLIAQQQRQRQRAVHSEPAHSRAEPRPHGLPTQRPGAHRAPFQCRSDARPFVQGHVLNLVDLSDKRCARRQRLDHVVDPVDPQQRHPGTLSTRYRANSESRYLSEQFGQSQTVRHHTGEVVDPCPQVGSVGAGSLGGQRHGR